jgi:hypothetical protein
VATTRIAGLAEVCWRIVPLETPRVWRRCATCGTIRPFSSSDNFRINAQQRKVDVWLIYRCTACDTTWNRTIFTRCTPEEIGAELYQRLQRNDRETAWKYAFDFGLLYRLGARVDAVVQVRVEHLSRELRHSDDGGRQIVLELPYQCSMRLDRLLADELGVSRSCLQRWLDRGLLRVWPEEKNALRKPIRNGQLVVIVADAYAMSRQDEERAAVAAVGEAH